MSNINKHWNRWLMSSVYDHFKKGLTDVQPDQVMTINFDSEDTQVSSGKGTKRDSIEFKHLGPDFQYVTGNECNVVISINLLVVTYTDLRDPFRHMNNVGLAQSLFAPCIPVYRHGPYPDTDDKSYLTQLTTEPNSVKTTNFGAYDPVTRVLRTTVEATYMGLLEGED